MKSSLKSLIEVFEKQSLEELKNKPNLFEAVRKEYKRKKNQQEYDDDFYLVKCLKEDIEDIALYDNHLKQAQECLFTINTKAEELNFKAIEILTDLIAKSFYEKLWKKNTRSFYDRNYPIVVHWKHFFFSYTNRNAEMTNDDFKHCFTDVWNEELNCLAKFIVGILEGHNLTGFWDYNDIDISEDIEAEIRMNCKQAFSFVQLIEMQCTYETIACRKMQRELVL